MEGAEGIATAMVVATAAPASADMPSSPKPLPSLNPSSSGSTTVTTTEEPAGGVAAGAGPGEGAEGVAIGGAFVSGAPGAPGADGWEAASESEWAGAGSWFWDDVGRVVASSSEMAEGVESGGCGSSSIIPV